MRIDINWKNGTYTFKHGNRIVTKNTLQKTMNNLETN